jgi:hypothetical protein
MGTRSLTIVKINKSFKVAQYGQWDGYPSVQGVTILETLRNCNLDELKEKCSKVSQIQGYKLKYLWSEAQDLAGKEEKDSKKEFVSVEVADKFKSMYPHLHRDCGGRILHYILNGVDEVFLNVEFATSNSFACEWCYVVDFDENVFQVYNGTYYKENLLKEFDLNSLPDEKEFLKECEELEEN